MSDEHKQLSTSAMTAERLLYADPRRFDFASAARLIRLLAVKRGDAPNEEIHHQLRMRSSPSPIHPATEIDSIESSGPSNLPELTINHPSLLGTMGKLPQLYNRMVRDSVRDQENGRDGRVLLELLNILQNALAGVYLAAKDETNLALDRERMNIARTASQNASTRHDRFSQKILDMLGLGDFQRSVQLDVDPDVFVRHVGLFLARQPTAAGLTMILSDYFDERVVVCDRMTNHSRRRWDAPGREFGGKFPRSLPAPARASKVGRLPNRFRVSLGPMSWERFSEFVPPTGRALKPLIQLTQIYVGAAYTFDVRLRLKRDEVPDCIPSNCEPRGRRLTWGCWLKQDGMQPPTDVETVVSAQYCRQLSVSKRLS